MFNGKNVVIYTDGSSFIKDDFYESSGAMIMTINNKEVYRYGEYFENGTNSKGEVYAMKFAYDKIFEMIDINNINSIMIICDSEYVVNSVNKWIYSWNKNNWITSSGAEPKFCDVFKYLYQKYLDKKIRNKKIKVYHINSHQKSIPKARRKFQVKNDIDVTQDQYDIFVEFNNKVDEFANLIRMNKEAMEFYNKGSDVEKRDGCVVIHSRTRE